MMLLSTRAPPVGVRAYPTPRRPEFGFAWPRARAHALRVECGQHGTQTPHSRVRCRTPPRAPPRHRCRRRAVAARRTSAGRRPGTAGARRASRRRPGHPDTARAARAPHQRAVGLRREARPPLPLSHSGDRRSPHAIQRARPAVRPDARLRHRHPPRDHHRPHPSRIPDGDCRDQRPGPRRTRLPHHRRRHAGPDPADGLERLVHVLRKAERRPHAQGGRHHDPVGSGGPWLRLREHRRLVDGEAGVVRSRRAGPGAGRARHDQREWPLPGHEGDDRLHPRTRPEGRPLHVPGPAHVRGVLRLVRTRGAGRGPLRGVGVRLPQVRLVLVRRGGAEGIGA